MKKVCYFLFLMVMVLKVDVVWAATLNCKNQLAFQSTGSQVKLLQEELNRTMDCNLEGDGIFGSRTRACVLEFQKKYQLNEDGIVGSKTCQKLNTAYAVEAKKKYVVVIAKKLNVRSGANMSSAIKGVVKQGEALQVYGTKKVNGITWYKVYIAETNVDTHYGYVHGNYVKQTAMVLDIKEQQLTYYRSGKILMSVPVITGMKGNHDTPVGQYTIKASDKTTNTVLRGENDDGSTYNAPVSYWMPFINERGIGFHDASWRDTDDYTAETYLENGSHGCVNMRYYDAKKLYENLTGSVDVIVTDTSV